MTRLRSLICSMISAVLVLSACGDSTEFSDTQIESFVAESGLPNVTGPFYFTRLEDYQLQTFSIGFGDVIDCPPLLRMHASADGSECRSAAGTGLRLGERVGWLKLEEGGVILPEDDSHFDVTGADDAVLVSAMWEMLKARDAQFYNTYFKERIVLDGDTPLSVLHRMTDELTEWISPTIGHLLLDNATAAGDQSLVAKLAALPVYQGDPYAEVRSRAQQLLST